MVVLKNVSTYKHIVPRQKVEVIDNIVQGAQANREKWHITQEELAILQVILPKLQEKVEKWESPHQCTAEVRTDLRKYEAATDAVVMEWINDHIMYNPYITAAERVGLGMPEEPRKKPETVPVPSTPVTAIINAKKGGRMEFKLYSTSAGKRVGKPAGVLGCEFHYGQGENLLPEQCTHHEPITKSLFIKEFDRSEWEKPHTAYFRWYNSKGEFGPWGVAYRFVPIL